jgi:manganese oxidase
MCLNTICLNTHREGPRPFRLAEREVAVAPSRTCYVFAVALGLLGGYSGSAGAHDEALRQTVPRVAFNDNRQAAGVRRGASRVLTLRAGVGLWTPEGDEGPALRVEAFSEGTGPMQVPAPLVRVPEGIEIIASIHNDLDATLQVHGLCTRNGNPCPAIDVPASSRRDVRFESGRAGTYYYWATTTRMPLSFRGAADTQLSGAFIVDPPDVSSPADRILVITEWTSITRQQLQDLAAADDPGAMFRALNPRFTFLINGLSWPATERLSYRLGEDVRWRVINLSSQSHPMHLHGFYFTVESLGDGVHDSPFEHDRKPQVVTQLLTPGRTMVMTWRPEREGNWLFHCHISAHISPERRLAEQVGSHTAHSGPHDGASGMAGMILGVNVLGRGLSSPDSPQAAGRPARKLTLTMESEPGRYGVEPGYGFGLPTEGDGPVNTISVPGPTLVLQRGEPVEITLVNRLSEATAIHWHGMELDSYYDGVHGWSGTGTRATPLIEPGGTFVVRFAPPRTGTFIYHTHLHDDRQLASGLYGALLVMEPGETFDPAFDHVVVIGRGGPGRDAPIVLNGSRDQGSVWKAGSRHRVRLINITPDDTLVASLETTEAPVTWRPLTKDGAAVPHSESTPRPATQTIAVGETFDFEYQAPVGRQSLWINVRTPAGRWGVQGRVAIK